MAGRRVLSKNKKWGHQEAEQPIQAPHISLFFIYSYSTFYLVD